MPWLGYGQSLISPFVPMKQAAMTSSGRTGGGLKLMVQYSGGTAMVQLCDVGTYKGEERMSKRVREREYDLRSSIGDSW